MVIKGTLFGFEPAIMFGFKPTGPTRHHPSNRAGQVSMPLCRFLCFWSVVDVVFLFCLAFAFVLFLFGSATFFLALRRPHRTHRSVDLVLHGDLAPSLHDG